MPQVNSETSITLVNSLTDLCCNCETSMSVHTCHFNPCHLPNPCVLVMTKSVEKLTWSAAVFFEFSPLHICKTTCGYFEYQM
jgi:hypothetical protein